MTSKNDKAASLAAIEQINSIDSFDPAPFAVEFNDLNTGEKRKRLPVMIQMAWFRMKYPEGRIAVQVSQDRNSFIAKARIYPSYKDGADCYLAEAEASRSIIQDKPSVSPREWAQTAAIGIALRNAGFGLQFATAGEDPEDLGSEPLEPKPEADPLPEAEAVEPPHKEEPPELTPEQQLEKAMCLPCPITKYNGKTLGDMISLDPRSLVWIANKYTGSAEVSAAAKLLCEYASQMAV